MTSYVYFQIGPQGDSPTLAIENKHEVKHNDIIVVASDGLFDNMDGRQIGGIILPVLEKSDDIDDVASVAEMIAKQAFKFSLNPYCEEI